MARIHWSPEFDGSAPWVRANQIKRYAGLVKADTPVVTGTLLRSYREEVEPPSDRFPHGRAWLSSDTEYGYWVMESGTAKMAATHRLSRIASQLRGEAEPGKKGERARKRTDVAEGERRAARKSEVLGRLRKDLTKGFQFRLAAGLNLTTTQEGALQGALRRRILEKLGVPLRGVKTAVSQKNVGRRLQEELARRVSVQRGQDLGQLQGLTERFRETISRASRGPRMSRRPSIPFSERSPGFKRMAMAQKRIREQLTGRRSEVLVSGMDPDLAEMVGDALDQAAKMSKGAVKFDSVEASRQFGNRTIAMVRSRYRAGFNPRGKSEAARGAAIDRRILRLNLRLFSDKTKLEGLMKSIGPVEQGGNGFQAGGDAMHVLRHEIGHVVATHMPRSEFWAFTHRSFAGVSKYATTGPRGELFAEAYARAVAQPAKNLSGWMRTFIERLTTEMQEKGWNPPAKWVKIAREQRTSAKLGELPGIGAGGVKTPKPLPRPKARPKKPPLTLAERTARKMAHKSTAELLRMHKVARKVGRIGSIENELTKRKVSFVSRLHPEPAPPPPVTLKPRRRAPKKPRPAEPKPPPGPDGLAARTARRMRGWSQEKLEKALESARLRLRFDAALAELRRRGIEIDPKRLAKLVRRFQ